MDNTAPRARSELSAAAVSLGVLAILAFGGFLLLRRRAGGRRAGSRRAGSRRAGSTGPPLPADRLPKDLVEEAVNLLGAIRGYCELAKLKGENGDALESRMDASIETVDEVSALLRRLPAACRRRRDEVSPLSSSCHI